MYILLETGSKSEPPPVILGAHAYPAAPGEYPYKDFPFCAFINQCFLKKLNKKLLAMKMESLGPTNLAICGV